MANQKEDLPETSIFRSSRTGTRAGAVGERQEPGFGRFHDTSLEEYEEPDRDTDYFSGYNARDEHLEEEQDDLFDQGEIQPVADQPVAELPNGGSWSSRNVEQGTEHAVEAETHTDTNTDTDTDTDNVIEDAETAIEEEPEDPAEWIDDEDEYEADDVAEPAMPLRLIAVAVVALLLLIVGAYGVLQERAAMQDELTELRAALATGVKESDLVDTQEALRELQAAYDTLSARSSALSRENSELQSTIAALETQQVAAETDAKGQAAVTEAPAGDAAESAAQKPAEPEAPTAAAAVKTVRAPAPQGNWFVNFGSYTSREMAQSWAGKLSPVQGEVVVVPTTKDGRTYYRVRVIGLSAKNAAELVARQLEAEMQVSRLWVGQE